MYTLHRTRLGLALAGLSLALSASAAHAQTTAFTNFGPGNTFNSSTGSIESGPTSSMVSVLAY